MPYYKQQLQEPRKMVLQVSSHDGIHWSIHMSGNPSASSAGVSGSLAFRPLTCMPHPSGAVKTD